MVCQLEQLATCHLQKSFPKMNPFLALPSRWEFRDPSLSYTSPSGRRTVPASPAQGVHWPSSF